MYTWGKPKLAELRLAKKSGVVTDGYSPLPESGDSGRVWAETSPLLDSSTFECAMALLSVYSPRLHLVISLLHFRRITLSTSNSGPHDSNK